jgi:predicted PurR-regulated permease PerM
MPDEHDAAGLSRLTASWIEVTVRLGILLFLLYGSLILVRPFISIAIWALVLTVALYPIYDAIVGWLGGRRRLAATLLTLLTLLIVIGPAFWLVIGLIDSLRTLTSYLDATILVVPPPADAIKTWPLVGEPIYQFWALASGNLGAALAKTLPHLRPLGSAMLSVAADAGTGVIKFLIAVIITGFLYPPAPSLAHSLRAFARRLVPARGDAFVQLVGATIRTVARGIIGISVLQALLVGLGLLVADIPGASLITSAALILGIIQIGPSIVIIPLIVWSWFAMETTAAVLFTAYMIPVSLLDNILRPVLLGRGLQTPMLVILIGVIGGTLAYGITGLFLGPIFLAVMWELLAAWITDTKPAPEPHA